MLQHSTETAQPGDTVCVSLQVYGFDSIATIQFPINWDTSGLELLSFEANTSKLPGFNVASYHTTLDAVKLSWNSPAGMGISLFDGTELFSLCFRAKPQRSGFFPVYIGAGRPDYEVGKVIPPNWKFVQMPFSQEIGGVWIGNPSPPPPTLRAACTSEGRCDVPNSLSVQVQDGTPPYLFQWEGPDGFKSSNPQIGNIAPGLYTLTVTDQMGLSTQGAFRVKKAISGIWTTVGNSKSSFCGGPSGEYQVRVGGGVPPYTFQWSSGNSETDAVTDLVPGDHFVVVTDKRGCSEKHNFNTLRDDWAAARIESNKFTLQSCKDRTSLKAQIANRPLLNDLSFIWSTGATTNTIEDVATGNYSVTISHANGCSAQTSARVWDTHTSLWRLNTKVLCAPVQSIELQGNTIFMAKPITVTWSDGTTRLATGTGNILDTLKNVPPGRYSVTVSDADGCINTAQITIACTPTVVGNTDTLPFFYVQDDFLNPQFDVDTCAGVYVKNFHNLTAVSLEWGDFKYPPLEGIRIKGWPGLQRSNFEAKDKSLILRWQASQGQPLTLADSTLLFEMCFADSSFESAYIVKPIKFIQSASKPEVRGSDGQETAFAGRNGYVMYQYWFPDLPPYICGIDVSKPDCSTDGYASLRFIGCEETLQISSIYKNDFYFGNANSLRFMPPGYYDIHTISWSTDYTFVKIPYETDTTQSCMWPGDTDNNNATNHHDLLAIGIAHGANGSARTGASLNWVGQYSPAWQQTIPSLKTNYKNIDANGDGAINAADTFAIALNWGSVINPIRDDPYAAPGGGLSLHNAPPLRLPSDTLFPSESVQLPLSFGTPDMPLDSFYGLAFSVSYDPTFLKPGVHFSPRASWMGKPEELLWMQRDFHEQGRLDVAITRTDGKPVKGGGYIGEMFIVIEDNIFGLKAANNIPVSDTQVDSIKTTVLYLGKPECVNANGATGPVRCEPAQLVIKRKTTGIKNIADVPLLSLHPTPATDRLQIRSPEAVLQRLEIIDWRGVLVASQPLNGTQAYCSVANLPPGGYIARVYTEAGVAVRKILVNR